MFAATTNVPHFIPFDCSLKLYIHTYMIKYENDNQNETCFTKIKVICRKYR